MYLDHPPTAEYECDRLIFVESRDTAHELIAFAQNNNLIFHEKIKGGRIERFHFARRNERHTIFRLTRDEVHEFFEKDKHRS